MQGAPRGLRIQIGIFGRRNVGKSSILNALAGQPVSIVSEVAGTTTDAVEKAMELHPIGPVLFIDTAGIDDAGALGGLRAGRTEQLIDRADLALLVTDAWGEYERRLTALFAEREIPCIVVAGKADQRDRALELQAAKEGAERIVRASTLSGEGIDLLRRAIIEAAPPESRAAPPILGDLVPAGETAVLVVPIDSEAPKGRIILPQVQTIRDLLDHDAVALVVNERSLPRALARLSRPPGLVLTDSQAFAAVAAAVPPEIPLTSFSILFSRVKGDLAEAVRGIAAIDALRPGDRVLIAEACTHHPTGEDIGRVKIPRWLEQKVGGALRFDAIAGRQFPEELAAYKVVIHCAACVWNRREMLSRIARATRAGVPITNYGLVIAHSLGILDRALGPFPEAREIFRSLGK